jgi:hypothetical protein
MSHIAFDDELIDSNCRYKVSSCPKGAFVVEVKTVSHLLFEPCRAFAFEYLGDVGDTVSGICKKYHMDVINLDIKFQYLPLFPFGD